LRNIEIYFYRRLLSTINYNVLTWFYRHILIPIFCNRHSFISLEYENSTVFFLTILFEHLLLS